MTILIAELRTNLVLIGEPALVKRPLLEGLAQRIASEDVPDSLLDKRIVLTRSFGKHDGWYRSNVVNLKNG